MVLRLDINTHYTSYTIKHLMDLDTKNQLNVDPPYQRNVVWSLARQRGLIYSLLINCPIPSLMLSQNVDRQFNILDGKQRLNAIKAFYNNKYAVEVDGVSVHFKTMSLEMQCDFMNKSIPVSLSEGLSVDEEATIFERINRAEKLSDGERINSYYKSALATDRDKFFSVDNAFYRKLSSMFGEYTVNTDKRKAHLANQIMTLVVFADGTQAKGTFDILQPFLEKSESEWNVSRPIMYERINAFVELWDTVLNKNSNILPSRWKKPAKIWKHSFLTSYIIYSMIEDPQNYAQHWIQFITVLCRTPEVYDNWPHTTVTKSQASTEAKALNTNMFANGYHQIKYYNKHGHFDKKDSETQIELRDLEDFNDE